MKKNTKGFDSNLYLELQTAEILKRIEQNNNKLYLEFGGKIFDDLHASRVLPGYKPDNKIKLLKKLKDESEIILVINSADIERNKIRADFNLTYDMEMLRLTDNLRAEGLTVSAIVITMFTGQSSAKVFGNKLERRNENVYYHNYTKGYPNDIETIVSDEGFGANPYIKTTKPLVIVAAPGPNSGKLATCLSQIYHEFKKGNEAGYAKYETFPVWDLPLKHPVNVAYEAATADLKDTNMIDHFHFNKYGIISVNYNRDIESFPIIKNIFSKIFVNKEYYNSPTDMCVNMISKAITDDEIVQKASVQEIIRRHYNALCDYKKGLVDMSVPERIGTLMNDLEIDKNMRKVVVYALKKCRDTNSPAFALELHNGKIITGRTKKLIGASTACILNSLKELSGIKDCIDLIPNSTLNPILELNKKTLHTKNEILSLKDVLIALSVSAPANPMIVEALNHLKELKNTEAHCTFILNPVDEIILKKLGINVTCEPQFLSNNLFEH